MHDRASRAANLPRSQAAAGARRAGLGANRRSLITRAIPESGERLPAVGLGTAYVFDRDDETTRQKAAAVVQALVDGGGQPDRHRLDLWRCRERARRGDRGRRRCATSSSSPPSSKSPDAAELKRSLTRLKTREARPAATPQRARSAAIAGAVQGMEGARRVPLHRHHLDLARRFPAVEAVLEREKPDFVQIDYSLDDREAEKRILPLAAEVKAGVLTALPFGRGRLFRAVHGKELPDWAKAFAGSWAQFFLKYLLGDPRVTAVIPGTADPAHMTDNLGAMRGPLPDADQRRRMAEFVASL